MGRYYAPGAWRGSHLAMPRDLSVSVRPLVIVCGAPASGKSTWASENADDVIDLDVINQQLSGYPFRETPIAFLAAALQQRNAALQLCATEGPSTAFIVGAPESGERQAWADMLSPQRVVVLNPGQRTCRARLLADKTRATIRRRQITALDRWYQLYTPAPCDEVIGDGDSGNPHRRLYNSTRWRKMRAAHLKTEPICRYCKARGFVNDGTRTATGAQQTIGRRRSLIADHIEQHHGDPEKFWNGELQTLCADHHDIAKQGEEHRGYSTQIGDDGWPVDSRHPAGAKG